MTDANSMLDRNAVKELMAAFTSDDIAYVCGRLSIVNREASDVSSAEAGYWDSDLATREIEGRIQTITAGNGALCNAPILCVKRKKGHMQPRCCGI